MSSIPSLSISDLPSKIIPNSLSTRQAGGVDYFWRQAPVNSLVHVDVAYSLSDFTDEEVQRLFLFTQIFSRCPVDGLSTEETDSMRKSLFGRFSTFVDITTGVSGSSETTFFIRFSTLSEDIGQALGFFSRMMHSSQVSDPGTVKALLKEVTGDFRDALTWSAHSFSLSLASSWFSTSSQRAEKTGGVSQYLYLCELEKAGVEAVGLKMEKVFEKLSDRKHLKAVSVCAEKDLFKLFEPYLSCCGRADFTTSVSSVSRTLHIERSVNLPMSVNSCAYSFPFLGVDDIAQVDQILASRVLGDGALWNAIRAAGGAYGVFCAPDIMERTFSIVTFRDPRLLESFADIRAVLESAAREPFSSEELDNAKIVLMGEGLKPRTPRDECFRDFRRKLSGITDSMRELRQQRLLEATPAGVQRQVAHLVASADRADAKVVFTSLKSMPFGKENSLSISL